MTNQGELKMHSSPEQTTANNIAILGAGAIGQLIFHQLADQGVAAKLLVRRSENTEKKLTITTLDGQTSIRTAQMICVDKLVQPLSDINLLIVCTKAYQVVDAVSALLPKLADDCHILLLHNGLGPHIALSSQLKHHGLTLGTTSQGALKNTPWHVTQTGAGISQLGPFQGPVLAPDLQALLRGTLPNSQWCDPILPMLWEKLAVNIAINPLSAIHHCRNGQLAEPQYKSTIDALLKEVVTVAQADGIALDKSALSDRVFNVIALTQTNYSSMHQDVHHQRKTEIDAITGYLLTRAESHGITAATNQALYEQLKQLEQKYLDA
ncbi:2-dehydropantoate 2-reductase [Shewanella colwelliana]|uniref:2-dehydropantoate 2-reductase n=2 Tax=Shewanella colwelliana TaxID=23 RepID=A0A1E5IU78_SHECO|nr:2-dehydropantoate 2-reductase [Shewanella colwelliana]